MRPFLTRPLVIDWLQWENFPESMGKPDYPQMTLSLIEEYRLENKRYREALERISNAEVRYFPEGRVCVSESVNIAKEALMAKTSDDLT